jgi:glycosyltransferase involved in cell wall biosynthesis
MASEIQIKKEKFTIVAVGRLCEAKNYKLMLDTAEELNHRHICIELWILGGGELENSLISYKKQKKIDNVKFIGATINPYPYIKCADLYLSTSIYEGLSTTTIEALILGKPCVVTDCTGMRNILGDYNEYGIVTSFDISDIADQIERIIKDDALRMHLVEKAKERAKYFDPENAFQQIEELM